MTVFLLTVYICGMIGNSDIREHVCDWKVRDHYYATSEECVAATHEFDDNDNVETANCVAIKVL